MIILMLSESAFEKLQEEAAQINCRVHRANGLVEIPMNQIVVGDIVLLQSGDRVPADGMMIKGNLDVDQSALNGESKEAQKFSDSSSHIPGDAGSDFLNPALLFSGTIVCGGRGSCALPKWEMIHFMGVSGSRSSRKLGKAR